MNSKSMLRSRLASLAEEVDREGRYLLAAGRAGTIGAILMFLCCYLYGIAAWGAAPTIAIGWLPCGLVAWGTANLLVPLCRPAFRLLAIAFRFVAPARPVAAHRI